MINLSASELTLADVNSYLGQYGQQAYRHEGGYVVHLIGEGRHMLGQPMTWQQLLINYGFMREWETL